MVKKLFEEHKKKISLNSPLGMPHTEETKGITRIIGVQGVSGTQGVQGTQGIQGTQGVKGLQEFLVPKRKMSLSQSSFNKSISSALIRKVKEFLQSKTKIY